MTRVICQEKMQKKFKKLQNFSDFSEKNGFSVKIKVQNKK